MAAKAALVGPAGHRAAVQAALGRALLHTVAVQVGRVEPQRQARQLRRRPRVQHRQHVVAVTTVEGAAAGRLQAVVAGTAFQAVGTAHAQQRVVAHAAFQHVGGAVAGQLVGGVIASGVDRHGAHQPHVLEFGADDRVAQPAFHRVGAAAGRLDDHVTGVAHNVDVVARTAGHRVHTGAALQTVVAGATVHHVAHGVGRHHGAAVAEQSTRDVAEATGAGRLPLHAHRCVPAVLSVVDADRYRPGLEPDRVCGAARAAPRHHHAVQPQHGIQIVVELEAVPATGGDVDLAGEAHGPLVHRHAGAGAAGAPVAIQAGLDALEHRHAPAAREELRAQSGRDAGGRGHRLRHQHIVAVAAIQRVGAAAAHQRVGARAARQRVVAPVAFESVVEGVADAVVGAGSGEADALHVGARRQADVSEGGAEGVETGVGRLGDHVVQAVDHIGVVAGAASHRIVAAAAVEPVVAPVAREHVGHRVAHTLLVPGDDRQVLQVLRQHVAVHVDVDLDRVDATARELDDARVGAVELVGVVARATRQRGPVAVVGPPAARADQAVGAGVAGAAEVQGLVEVQVLEVRRQHEGARRAGVAMQHDGVVATAGLLHEHVVDVGAAGQRVGLQDVGVVAGTPHQGVVDASGEARGRDHVVAATPCGGDRGGRGDDDVLDLGAQPKVEAAVHTHRVVAAAGQFDDGVARVVDHVGVVASAAGHRVGAQAAIKPVVAGVADERVVSAAAHQRVVAGVAGDHVVQVVARAVDRGRARQHQPLDVGHEHEADRRLHRVGAGTGSLEHVVGVAGHHVGVVARAAGQVVGAGAADEAVVAGAAEQGVVAAAARERVVALAAQQHGVDAAGPALRRRAVVDGQRIGRRAGLVAKPHRRLDPGGVERQDAQPWVGGHGRCTQPLRAQVLLHLLALDLGQRPVVDDHLRHVAAAQLPAAARAPERQIAQAARAPGGRGHQRAVAVQRRAAARAGGGVQLELVGHHRRRGRRHPPGRVEEAILRATVPAHEPALRARRHQAAVLSARHLPHREHGVGVAEVDGRTHVVVAVEAHGGQAAGSGGHPGGLAGRAEVGVGAGHRVQAGAVHPLGHRAAGAEDSLARTFGHAVAVHVAGIEPGEQAVAGQHAGAGEVDAPVHFQVRRVRQHDRGVVHHDAGPTRRAGREQAPGRAVTERHDSGAAGVEHAREVAAAQEQHIAQGALGLVTPHLEPVVRLAAKQARGRQLRRGDRKRVDRSAAQVHALDAGDLAHQGLQRADPRAVDGQRVVAGATGQANEVGVAQHEGVAALAAVQRVGAAAAVEHVVGTVAHDQVGARVASGVDAVRADQHQVLELLSQHVADGRAHGVVALARQLVDQVAAVVDRVGVVAGAAVHRVGATAAVEQVVLGVAGQLVGPVVAGAGDGVRADQPQVLDMGGARHRVAHDRVHGVDAGARGLDHDVAGVVDRVGVVTAAASHRVGTFGTVEHVVAGVATQVVVLGRAGAVDRGVARELEVLEAARQRVGERGAHGVAAASDLLFDHIVGAVDDVDVVAVAAGQGVGARTAIQHVGAAVARDLVVEFVTGAVDVVGAGEREPLDLGTERVAHR